MTTYERVVRAIQEGKQVSPKELAEAWRECPTDMPPKEFWEYTARFLEESDK